ncbi:response regulator transcription factor [Acidovorax radicis]|nr:response regulator transcription factor [Acidovorax radicis]UCV01434.1 response regulator transcription factor [Acidovorax radicis]
MALLEQHAAVRAGLFSTYSNPPSVWPDFMVGQEAKPVRVLLVDDDEHVRRVIAQELMGDPRTLLIAQATSVREGRKAIKQHEFDVLLVDINLGDGLGFELLEYLHTVRPQAQAVVISVMESDDQLLRAFELGATGYLGKNSWFGSYLQAVLQVANGGASITPTLARRLLQRFDRAHAVESARRPKDEAEHLSVREKEILSLVASGYTSAEIGARLLISTLTVNTHVRNIYRKLQVRTRAQAVRFASLWGLL